MCDGWRADSVYDFWLRKKPLADSSPAVPYLGLLGSGSDHTAFIAVSAAAATNAVGAGGGGPL